MVSDFSLSAPFVAAFHVLTEDLLKVMPLHKGQIYELGLAFEHQEAQLVPRSNFGEALSASRRYVEVWSLVQFLPRVQSIQRSERNLKVVALRGDEMKSVALHPVGRDCERRAVLERDQGRVGSLRNRLPYRRLVNMNAGYIG